MRTPRPRHPMHWLAITASVAVAACASQPAPLALQPTLQLLMARASGLEVRSLGQGQFTLLVRGRPGLGDRQEPLVVIDGTPYTENGADVLASMTPRDVKRVEVLRDAASTSLYGTRGTNGVLLVTTRRGDY